MLTSSRSIRTVIGLTAVVAAAALAGMAAGGVTATSNRLVVLQAEIAPSLDTDGTAAGNPGLWTAQRNLMEPLVIYPTRQSGAVLVPSYKVGPNGMVPRLAVSYSRKGLVWTFKLRRGVKSCVGNELTADDVVYTFARGKSVSGAAPITWFFANVAAILPIDPLLPKATAADKQLKDEVRKIDKYTVQFKQQTSNELFPRVLETFGLRIYDSAEMRKHATSADPWSHSFTNTRGTAGFGPYCLKSWSKGSEIVLSANPNYYRGQPQFKEIVIRKVAQDSNRVAALRANAADIVTDLTPTQYESLRGVAGVDVLHWYNNQTAPLILNYKTAPWGLPGNQKLRQAVAYAIPYSDIISSDFKGHARAWYGLFPSTYNSFLPLHIYNTNIAKAKALLAQAGFPGGKGLEKYPEGLKLYYPAERAGVLEPVANRIRTALASIGMNIQLSPISQTEFSDRYQTKFDLPMSIVDFSAPFGPDAAYSMQLFYVSLAKGGVTNAGNYSNSRVDSMMARALKATGNARTSLLAAVQRFLMQELPVVPLYEFESQIAVRHGTTGWLIDTDNSLSFFEFRRS